MGDYRWLKAVADEKCSLCFDPIRPGDGFYWEAESKKPHCRACGRAIRVLGEQGARATRNVFVKLLGGFGRQL